MANDKGATQGERDNARSLLAKMKPEPVRSQPLGTTVDDFMRRWGSRSQGFTSSSSFGPNNRTYNSSTSFSSAEAQRMRDAMRNMSMEEMLAYIEKMFGSTRSYRPQPKPPKTSRRYDPPRDPFEDEKWRHDQGIHAWARVGYDVKGTPLHRCIICGQRQKTHNPASASDEEHDWKNDPRDDPLDYTMMWTQSCTGCNLRRINPDQPPLAAWDLGKDW